MHKLTKLLVFFLMTGLWSCQNQSRTEQKQNATTQQERKKSPKNFIEELPKLSDQNVEDLLLQFGSRTAQDTVVLITKYGPMKIKLHQNTPLHRANFLYLVQQKYFHGTEFYRVIKDFVIQGGNSDDQKIYQKRLKIGHYTLPAEFKPQHKHVKGALAMAREYENNPKKRSVPYDFYIVAGQKTPELDGEHTVFGHVVTNLSIIDSIAQQTTDSKDWPLQSVVMRIQFAE